MRDEPPPSDPELEPQIARIMEDWEDSRTGGPYRLTALLAAFVRDAVKAEREAAAKLVEACDVEDGDTEALEMRRTLAAVIRMGGWAAGG